MINVYGININKEIFDLGKTKLNYSVIAEGEKINDRILLYDILYYKKDVRDCDLKTNIIFRFFLLEVILKTINPIIPIIL